MQYAGWGLCWNTARVVMPKHGGTVESFSQERSPSKGDVEVYSDLGFTENTALQQEFYKAFVQFQATMQEIYGFKRMSCVGDISKPFIQGLRVAKSSQVFIVGDRHGDFASIKDLLRELALQGWIDPDTMTLTEQNTYIVFLGDYINKGVGSLEVLTAVMHLKINNPRQVIFLRGNHEDIGFATTKAEFDEEITRKLPDFELADFANLFQHLPLALFVEFPYDGKAAGVILTHGLVEPGFAPERSWLSLKRSLWGRPYSMASISLIGQPFLHALGRLLGGSWPA